VYKALAMNHLLAKELKASKSACSSLDTFIVILPGIDHLFQQSTIP
jgi:hypothetical protein